MVVRREPIGKVINMKYILTAVLCLLASSDALADQLRKFDEYADLPFSEEKTRLDNLGAEMRRTPDALAWYIIFAGKVSCADEARLRAVRAKNYLMKKYGIPADRIKWSDEGYRGELLVELWMTPRSIKKLTPTNYSNYDKNSVVIRNCKSNYHRRRRHMKL